MNTLSVEAIEEGFIVCENDEGEIVNIPLESIDFPVKVGSILIVTDNGEYLPDQAQEDLRRKKIQELYKKLQGED